MNLKSLIATGLLCSSGLALAQSYQFEAGGGLTHYDPDTGGSDTQVYARGTYHFTRVQTANRPLAEAGFLQRSSNAYARAYDNLDFLQVGAEFYIPNTMFYAAAEITRTDYSGANRNNDWGLRLGLTPIDGLLVWTGYYDEPGYDANIHAKYLVDLGRTNSVNIEGGFVDYDEDNSFYLVSDFYFDRSFSVGAGYIDEGADDDAFLLRTRKFFTTALSGEASFRKGEYDNTYNLGASMRF